MHLDNVFKILNHEAKEDSDLPLWYHDGDYSWYKTDHKSDIHRILHMNSETNPNFDADLCTYDAVTTTRNYWFLAGVAWRNVSDVCHSLPLPASLRNTVFLYQVEQPNYHPMQTRIANMLLDKADASSITVNNTDKATTSYILSEDENTLTVTEPSDEAGVYKAVSGSRYVCADCAFDDTACPSVGIEGHSFCAGHQRDDEREIYWMKQDSAEVETKQEPKIQAKAEATETATYQAKPHKHRESITKYIADTNQKVYCWNSIAKDWLEVIADPIPWYTDRIYAVGEKPTEPPAKLIKFPWGTIEFYAPYTSESFMYDGEVGDSCIYKVSGTLDHYFKDQEQCKLFQQAYEEYQLNLVKFLKGEIA